MAWEISSTSDAPKVTVSEAGVLLNTSASLTHCRPELGFCQQNRSATYEVAFISSENIGLGAFS